jgi:phosphatidylserine decarboxylase
VKGIVGILPLNHISFLVGKLAALRLPQPLAKWLLGFAARLLRIDLGEAAQPLEYYRSLAELFVRDLKPGARPLGAGLVSPVDGVLRSVSPLSAESVMVVKGQTLTVKDLLGDSPLVPRFHAGLLLNFYLSPRDYHHVHFPVGGKIITRTYIPGRLWPVNDWALKRVPGLFSVNERLATFVETDEGLVAVVMVGAANVGKMSLSYDALVTNQLWKSGHSGKLEAEQRSSPASLACEKGQRLGTFQLGSSVLVLTETTRWGMTVSAPRVVRYGETVAQLTSS